MVELEGGISVETACMGLARDLGLGVQNVQIGSTRRFAGLGSGSRIPDARAFCLPEARGPAGDDGGPQRRRGYDDEAQRAARLVGDVFGAALRARVAQGCGAVERSGHLQVPGDVQDDGEAVEFGFGRPPDWSRQPARERGGCGAASSRLSADLDCNLEGSALQEAELPGARAWRKGGRGGARQRPVSSREEGCMSGGATAEQGRAAAWRAESAHVGRVTLWWQLAQQACAAAEEALRLSLGSRGMVRGRLAVQPRLADVCSVGRHLLLDEWRSLMGMHYACATRSSVAGDVC